jgi:ATP-dependent DNA ligase
LNACLDFEPLTDLLHPPLAKDGLSLLFITLRTTSLAQDESPLRFLRVQVGGYVEARGKNLFQLAHEKGLEGIIGKRKASVYQSGRRSLDWLKIKSRHQQEFVVCGFTEGKGSRLKSFGALVR